MLSRHAARSLQLLGCAVLVASLGCKPEPAANDPEPSASSDGASEPTLVDTDATPAEPTDETDTANPDGASDGPNPDGTPTTDDPVAETNPKPVADDKPASREPLPKPIYELAGPTCQEQFEVGKKVKSFKLPNVSGDKTISPGGYRSRVMVLNFWGTWCKPCLAELPDFDRLYRKYRKHGMTLVAVATDEDPGPVQDFIDKHNLKAKVALEGEAAAGAYNRPQFPFTFVVDGSGTIVAAYQFIDDACMGDLEQVIRDELEQLDR